MSLKLSILFTSLLILCQETKEDYCGVFDMRALEPLSLNTDLRRIVETIHAHLPASWKLSFHHGFQLPGKLLFRDLHLLVQITPFHEPEIP